MDYVNAFWVGGLICALVVFIENAGGELEGYHYEAFNKFANAVRELEINATKEVKREYETVHASLEQEADRIKASESSISKLKKELKVPGAYEGLSKGYRFKVRLFRTAPGLYLTLYHFRKYR